MKSVFKVFASWRMFIILLLGFSSGIPLSLTGSTLQAWMTTSNIDLTIIGIFSLVGLPYTLKFLWSPLMDRFVPPFLGRRRGWMIITQVLLLVGIIFMGHCDPTSDTSRLATLAFVVAFLSSSQDIVIDAYRTEVLTEDEYGAGAGVYIMGYRIAMLVSGAIALILADHIPWRMVYLIMGLTVCVGIFASLFGPEPKTEGSTPKSLFEAVGLPFKEFFGRKGWPEVLSFIVLYKLDVVVTMAMITPFMLQLGFSKTDIGAVNKGFGLVATIVGTLVGGAIMTKLKIRRSLWFFGLFQGFSGITFTLLAHFGHSYPLMIAAITVENLCSGMGTAAYSAFLMSLCNKRFTATQYALLTSLMALTRVLAGVPTGFMAKNLGWESYFIVSTLLMIPGLLLLTRYNRWTLPNHQE